jgi:hypothetical protein
VELAKEASILRRMLFHCSSPRQQMQGRDNDDFGLDGRLDFRGLSLEAGYIDELSFGDGETIKGLPVVRGTLAQHGSGIVAHLEIGAPSGRLHARRMTGNSVQSLELEVSDVQGEIQDARGKAVVTVSDELSLIDAAVETLARETREGRSDVLANRPFRRAALLASLDEQLKLPAVTRCCLDDRGMPPPVADAAFESHAGSQNGHSEPLVGALRSFHHYCSACHHGEDRFPPNFLHGSFPQVEANLRQCAERILFRLGMWQVLHSERPEAPMPPATELLHQGIRLEQWPVHADLRDLKNAAIEWVAERRRGPVREDEFLKEDYDALSACAAPKTDARTAAHAGHG